MDKIKIFLNKNFTVIASLGIIILVVLASVAVYRKYLIDQLTLKFRRGQFSDAEFNEYDFADKLIFENKINEFLSGFSIKRLYGMNNLSDAEWAKIGAKLK